MVIVDKLHEYYERLSNSKHAKYFYVTDIAGCPRAVFFSMTGEIGEKTPAGGIKKMRMGSKIHEHLMGDMFSSGMRVVASEISIPDNELIHGRADCIVCIDNELILLDFKSIMSFGYKIINDKKLNEEHIAQVNLYLHFFNLKRGFLIYMNKDNQDLLEVEVLYDEKKALECLDKLKDLRLKIDNKILPEIPTNLEGWKCAYCSHRKLCKDKCKEKKEMEKENEN